MAKLYAFTNIDKIKEDGSVIHYEAGEEIKSGDFTRDEIKSLVEGGSVATYDRTAEQPDVEDVAEMQEELEAKDARIRELEEALAKSQGKPPSQASVEAQDPSKVSPTSSTKPIRK